MGVRRGRRRQQGLALILTVVGMVALLAMAAFTLDVGFIMTTRTQLQGAADAAALAAIQQLRDTGSSSQAEAAAREVAETYEAGGEYLRLGSRDVQVGVYDYPTSTFSPGFGLGAPAVEVRAPRDQGAPRGPIPLFFARAIGRDSANVSASAVAAIRRRDLVLVQDRTPSFFDEFPIAIDADKDLVNAMDAQGLSGDRVGLITFARDFSEEAALTTIGSGTSYLNNTIDAFVPCPEHPPPFGPCWGTDIGMGIDAARDLLERESTSGDAERVIVIVADGLPCFPEYGGAAVTHAQGLATAAADRAGDAGITIFAITLDHVTGGGICHASDIRFNETLIRGFGEGITIDDPADLDDALVSILREMPFYLVE